MQSFKTLLIGCKDTWKFNWKSSIKSTAVVPFYMPHITKIYACYILYTHAHVWVCSRMPHWTRQRIKINMRMCSALKYKWKANTNPKESVNVAHTDTRGGGGSGSWDWVWDADSVADLAADSDLSARHAASACWMRAECINNADLDYSE